VTVNAGGLAEFTVIAGGSAPLSYQWLLDGLAIPDATQPEYIIAPVSPAADGEQFQVDVTNPYGGVYSNIVTLSVISIKPPVPTITSPAPGTLYAGGESISFSGSATDPQQGPLDASALTWEIDLHDGATVTPVLGPVSGISGGTFTVPMTGDTSIQAFYQINLSATDSAGASQTTAVDIKPELTNLGLATSPAGLPLSVDGQRIATPRVSPAVVGLARTIAAPPTDILGGVIYDFAKWSDGSTGNPRIVDVPAAATTFIADYKAVGIVPPVTVKSVRTTTNRGSIQNFIVTFSAALNPTSATKVSGYWLVLPGHDHRFGTKDDKIIKFRKAVYQASLDTVTLTPAARVSATSAVELVVSGSTTKPHPTDIWGRPIDGNKDGVPGGNFVLIVGPAPPQVKRTKAKSAGAFGDKKSTELAALPPASVDAALIIGLFEKPSRRRPISP
jgi:hypothetical protein